MRNNIKAMREKTGLTQNDVAERLGLHLTNYNKLENGRTELKLSRAMQIADILGCSPTDLMLEDLNTDEVSAAGVDVPRKSDMQKDVPVMGTAAGSMTGAFQLTADVIDYVRRPPALKDAKGIFCLYVVGESMEPEYRPGALIFLNSNKPPLIGDAVVFEIVDGEGAEAQAMIGHLLRRTGDAFVIGKLNPPKEITVARSRVLNTHKVLTMNDLFGT